MTAGSCCGIFSLQKKLIAENEHGRYLLSRDLHSISFSQLKVGEQEYSWWRRSRQAN